MERKNNDGLLLRIIKRQSNKRLPFVFSLPLLKNKKEF